jgi:hypothetical protein
MAAKKTEAKPKAKAKAEPKAEEIEEAFEPAVEVQEPEQVKLPFTASQLAEMGRKFKAGQLSRQIVIDAHNAYLNAVKQGAEVSEADVKFVKGHLEVIKGW